MVRRLQPDPDRRPSIALPAAEVVVDDEVGPLPLGNLLPYAAVAAALLTSSFEVLRTGHSSLVVSWLRTGIMVLLVGRQLFTLLENQTLTRTLEDRVHARTAELTASRERFIALVQHSSDIVTMIDPHGVVGYQSASIHRILGYAAEDVEGASIYALMGPTEAAFLEQAIEHASAEELRIHTIMSSWQHADGHECRVEVTITNLLDTPHLGALVLNTRDVTDRVRLEEQLTGWPSPTRSPACPTAPSSRTVSSTHSPVECPKGRPWPSSSWTSTASSRSTTCSATAWATSCW
jgi:PAS domain S-box-containing protein